MDDRKRAQPRKGPDDRRQPKEMPGETHHDEDAEVEHARGSVEGVHREGEHGERGSLEDEVPMEGRYPAR